MSWYNNVQTRMIYDKRPKEPFFFCVCNIKADMWKYVDTFIVLFEIPLEIINIIQKTA